MDNVAFVNIYTITNISHTISLIVAPKLVIKCSKFFKAKGVNF